MALAVIRTGIFPSGLKTAKLTPILKPGKEPTYTLGQRHFLDVN